MKIIEWFKQSNRWAHLIVGFVVAFLCEFDTSICVAIAFEVKDCQHDLTNGGKMPWNWHWKCWDWLDFLCTVFGGVLGRFVHYLVF